MKKLFFHLLTFVCAGFTLLLAPGCNDDEGEKTGPTGDEGKEIYSLSVTPDKLEFQSTKQKNSGGNRHNERSLLGVYG